MEQYSSGSRSLADTIDAIRATIVQIGYQLTGLPPHLQQQIGRDRHHGSLWTGFFVNADGYVVTAQHVINAGRALPQQTGAQQVRLVVGVAMPPVDHPMIQMRGSFMVYEFDIMDEDPRHDLALLKLKVNPFTQKPIFMKLPDREAPLPLKIASINRQGPRDGAVVAVSGDPLGEPVLVTNAGWMASVWSYNTANINIPGMPEWLRRPDSADSYLADLAVNGGNSGGPVYLVENGLVMGVCVASKLEVIQDQQGNPVILGAQQLGYRSGLTIVVPTQYVVALLQKQNLTWSEAEPQAPAETPSTSGALS
jgi:S1-C subfamily serine protease